eukprot:Opistho-2@74972
MRAQQQGRHEVRRREPAPFVNHRQVAASPAPHGAALGNQARLRASTWRAAPAAPPAPPAPVTLPRVGRAGDAAEQRADRRAALATGHTPAHSTGPDPLGGTRAPPSVAEIARRPGQPLG